MDEFGVLTERYGLKQQGKSAPMAASKRSAVPSSNGSTRNFGVNSGLNAKPTSHNSNSPSAGFPVDIFFQSNANKSSTGFGDDVFGQFQSSATESSNGSSVDYDSIFNLSTSKPYANDDDDIFGLKNTKNDDVFGSFVPTPKQNGSVDDLLGGEFGGGELNSKNSNQNVGGFDDLIPGFGASSAPANGTKAETSESTFISSDDPFAVFERTSTPAPSSLDSFADPLDELGKLTQPGGRKPNVSSKDSPILKTPPKGARVSEADKDVSSIDELQDFAMGRVRSSDGSSSFHHPKENKERQNNKTNKHKEAEAAKLKTPQTEDDLESFFSVGSRSISVPKSRAKTSDPVFDAKVDRRGPDVGWRTSSGGSSNLKKVSSATNINMVDDLSSIFGAASVFGEFEEYEGESEERRRARLGHHQRTNARMAKAVADMNQRDFQTQQEQEERTRIADALEADIKRWVAGKEGNMRALLSSLQNVLWPESGWQPVSLTDLITSSSVKKVYRKATLFVHPDKVQQKGATVQQRFIAEKVFDILKEAWNKFNKEELS